MTVTIQPQDRLLDVEGIKVYFQARSGRSLIRAVDGVSFYLLPGETLGLVGESGCGKSTVARALMRVTPINAGVVRFRGEDIKRIKPVKKYYRRAQMIFQDPYASLNPRMTIGGIVGEPLRSFGIARGHNSRARVRELLSEVGLDPDFSSRYPHEFSGGQRQRVGIARALAVDPELIVADEPISALDVSIQAQIINLMMELQRRRGIAYLFIAHDLSVVRHISRRIAVMYLGRIVETAAAEALYHEPLHPYTRALLSAVPIPDPEVESKRKRILLPGEIPSPTMEFIGCPFESRCPERLPKCKTDPPPTVLSGDHLAVCHLAE